MKYTVPELSFVVLIGVSGSGKSTFAREHFKPTEILSSDYCRGLVQPAVKCRGREYLRIIYGPEYTATENLQRLRARGLSRKRSLALREFALGIEALERFARHEPLRRVHECVFGVLALESEPVDPRL
jgi:protein phosphatase